MNAVSFAPTYTKFLRVLTISADLSLRAPVKSAGVVVGRIANISFDDSDLPSYRHHDH